MNVSIYFLPGPVLLLSSSHQAFQGIAPAQGKGGGGHARTSTTRMMEGPYVRVAKGLAMESLRNVPSLLPSISPPSLAASKHVP